MKKMDGIYQHRSHNKNLLVVHLVLVTKYRKKLLYSVFRDDIKQYVYGTCVKHHWHIRRMETDVAMSISCYSITPRIP